MKDADITKEFQAIIARAQFFKIRSTKWRIEKGHLTTRILSSDYSDRRGKGIAIFTNGTSIRGVKDSKDLTEEEIQKILVQIQKDLFGSKIPIRS